ncbi:hyccin-like [Photinus pyralis]|uniref:hyccin-like n=1 Tax=Photinus pyralis TaxID=7054 RepID=UPI0012673BE3|nr:hyccin-like [Photinus pyralis]
MADVLILDWLEEYESLTESEIHTYSTEQEQNYEVMKALYAFLEDPNKSKVENFLDRVCQQLFSFYRSGEQNLKYFTMQYIPSLVLLNLANTKGFPSVGTLLLSIYNLEVVDNKGQSHIISFRVPSIAQSSIYHDSSNLEPAFIAENALRRWEECNSKLVNWGPLPQVENLNAQNRQRVVTALMFLYNQHIGKIFVDCLEYGCRTISRGRQAHRNIHHGCGDDPYGMLDMVQK